MQGIACNTFGIAKKICSVAFENGLIIETSGPNDEVIKLLPSLTIDLEGLSKGLEMLEDSISTIFKRGNSLSLNDSHLITLRTVCSSCGRRRKRSGPQSGSNILIYYERFR